MNRSEKSTESLSSNSQKQLVPESKYESSSNVVKNILYKFNIYDVNVVVDQNDRFIGINSIRISKSFIKAVNLPDYIGESAEELIDKFLKEQDD